MEKQTIAKGVAAALVIKKVVKALFFLGAGAAILKVLGRRTV